MTTAKTFNLTQAHVFYGASTYDIHGLEQFGFDTLTEGTPISRSKLGFALANCIGCSAGATGETFAKRIKKVTRRAADPEFGLKEMVIVVGEGFSLAWTAAK